MNEFIQDLAAKIPALTERAHGLTDRTTDLQTKYAGLSDELGELSAGADFKDGLEQALKDAQEKISMGNDKIRDEYSSLSAESNKLQEILDEIKDLKDTGDTHANTLADLTGRANQGGSAVLAGLDQASTGFNDLMGNAQTGAEQLGAQSNTTLAAIDELRAQEQNSSDMLQQTLAQINETLGKLTSEGETKTEDWKSEIEKLKEEMKEMREEISNETGERTEGDSGGSSGGTAQGGMAGQMMGQFNGMGNMLMMMQLQTFRSTLVTLQQQTNMWQPMYWELDNLINMIDSMIMTAMLGGGFNPLW